MHWSWNHRTDRLWRSLDARLWDCTHNPRIVLQTVSRDRLPARLSDRGFRNEVDELLRDLLAREAADVRAAEAVALYCYQVTKSIGAFAAALGGLDTLVFSGGIGENAPVIRQRICDRLGFLGVALDDNRNTANEDVISADVGAVTVRMIRTDEEAMIARTTQRILHGD
jgi:acetate kinase